MEGVALNISANELIGSLGFGVILFKFGFTNEMLC